jgi:integrase
MPTVTLTDRAVQAAKAEKGKRLELWDAKCPGLCLRVSENGSKAWVYRYRTADGRQPRLKLGDYSTAYGLKEARRDAELTRVQVRAGADPASDKRRERNKAAAQPIKTAKDLAASYFKACEIGEYRPRGKTKKASTLAEERGLWRRHLEAPLGRLRLREIGPADVRDILRGLVAAGHGTTANRVRALLRQIFNFAIELDLMTVNPVAKVPALAAERARDRILSDKELRALWAALADGAVLRKPPPESGGEGERVYVSRGAALALKLAMLTLQRRAEIACLTRAELDLAQASWTIPAERTKNGRAHLVPLSKPAVELIEAAMKLADAGQDEPSPVVFPSPRNRKASILPGALSHAVADLCAALDIPKFTLHDLRRTGASVMASERLRVSPFVIGRVLNHTTETGGAAAVTLAHYAVHDFSPEKRAALAAWADVLMTVVGESVPAAKVSRLSEGRRRH